MHCKEVRNQFTDYVSGQIDEPLRSAVLQHLAGCEECSDEAAELLSLWKALGSIPKSEPGPEIQTHFERLLDAYEQGLGQMSATKWWQLRRSRRTGSWSLQPAITLGLALALLILGVLVGGVFHGLWTSPGTSPIGEVAELRAEVAQMRQMVALSLLQQQSASDRLKGVNWSYQLQQPGTEILTALLEALMHDSNVNVRLATIDALRQFGDQPVVRRGVVEAMTRQESPMVQIALIDLAVDLREKESVPVLRQLREDQNIDQIVRERAQRRLPELE